MTEDEAKTKWCPHARFNGDNMSESGDLAKCIASDCMMWESEYISEDKTIDKNEKIPGGWYSLNINQEKRLIRRYAPTNKGDCGLKSKECVCAQ